MELKIEQHNVRKASPAS